MEKKQLQESLKNLHSELQNTESVDENAKEILHNLTNDIQRILEHPEDTPSLDHHTLKERLKESVQHFETSHPKLTDVMENVINSLSNIGI